MTATPDRWLFNIHVPYKRNLHPTRDKMEIKDFATVNPAKPGFRVNDFLANGPVAEAWNLVNGHWQELGNSRSRRIIDPLTGQPMIDVPAPSIEELAPFGEHLKNCPLGGRHNPRKHEERYLMLGRVCKKAAEALAEQEVEDFFTQLIQRVMPKSDAQCRGEVRVTCAFLANYGSDRVRFLATGTTSPGDHAGQRITNQRHPYGPVVVIAPFNFPLEIPVLQVMGALFMGNAPLVHVDQRVAVVFHQFVRLLHSCGLPLDEIDLMTCEGKIMGEFLDMYKNDIALVQFTGSSEVAGLVSQTMNGRIKKEDAGFDWKILGPDYSPEWLEYIAHQSDQDAYAASGQKCSAQSLLAWHNNWPRETLIAALQRMAQRRSLQDLTIGPVLSWTTRQMLDHVRRLCELEGAELLFGGKELTGHNIPECYGALEPTAVFVPLKTILQDEATRQLVTTEVFGPVQVLTEFDDASLEQLIELLASLDHRLTAAVVSNDPLFVNNIVGHVVNGTTYVGMRARTTGAPQNHWFGPHGDPRDAGIGTDEAIRLTWSCPVCVIEDPGPIPASWTPTLS